MRSETGLTQSPIFTFHVHTLGVFTNYLQAEYRTAWKESMRTISQ